MLNKVKDHIAENEGEDDTTEAKQFLSKFTVADKKQYDLIRL